MFLGELNEHKHMCIYAQHSPGLNSVQSSFSFPPSIRFSLSMRPITPRPRDFDRAGRCSSSSSISSSGLSGLTLPTTDGRSASTERSRSCVRSRDTPAFACLKMFVRLNRFRPLLSFSFSRVAGDTGEGAASCAWIGGNVDVDWEMRRSARARVEENERRRGEGAGAMRSAGSGS